MSTISRYFWKELVDYSLERSCAGTAFMWGLWVLLWKPISSGSPMVAGLHLMDEVFGWLPFSSDFAWGALTILPALLHIRFIIADTDQKVRGHLALFKAAVFLFITLLIGMANWRTTGIAMYGGLAVAEFACYAQLVHRRHRHAA